MPAPAITKHVESKQAPGIFVESDEVGFKNRRPDSGRNGRRRLMKTGAPLLVANGEIGF